MQGNASNPRRLKVRYSEPAPHKGDRTTLRFHLPEQTVCVAVEDVVAQRLRVRPERRVVC